MNLNQEVRIVRLSLVIAVVASTIGFVVLFVVYPYENSGISLMSGFGKITVLDPKQPSIFENNMYYDNDLAFQLSKPNDSWNISQASESISAQEIEYLKSKGYLEGVYLEKESDKLFLISVFNMQTEDFQLKDYVSKQISSVNSQNNIKIPIKQISQSNDWALLAFDRETNDEDSYSEQLLFLKDNKLYMLQYSGKSPNNLTTLEKSELNLVLDSFEVSK
ncbi:hypothetical protein AAA799P11_00002 [Marine Group I thaumarchaeote SCGC AAA799-P11]|uniref:Uncharacterized protein n=1 Tax=Marine Group I thaumarchaeote SCGC AAA799-P11 TaxID=1502295 RepID=A0A087S3F1_9ARCH|nr:hypothetical protein AAA799P11_00002 [Marine Group I thaumarchaeote SCGC AAA799-P11]